MIRYNRLKYASQDQINNINQRLLTSNVIYGISFVRFLRSQKDRRKRKKSLSCQITFSIVLIFRGKLIFASFFFNSQIYVDSILCSMFMFCLFVCFYGIKPNNVSIKECHTNYYIESIAKYSFSDIHFFFFSFLSWDLGYIIPTGISLKPEYFNFSLE